MNQETLAQQARTLLDKHKYKQTLTLLEDNRKIFTAKLPYWLLKSEAHYRLKKGKEALEAAEAALVLAPDNAVALWCRGNAYRLLKNYAAAAADYTAAIDLQPHDARPYNGLGIVYRNQQDYAKAIAYYEKSIKKDPDYARPYNGLGNVYSDQQDYAKAIVYYEKSIEKDPDDAVAYYNLGNMYSDQKDYAKAVAYYEKSIEKDPDYAYPYNGLGIVYRDQQDYEKAIGYYEKSIEKDPDDAVPYNNLGIVYADRGNYKKALTCYEKAIKKDPGEFLYYCNRGNAYKELKDYDKALADYDDALRLNPKDYWAQQDRNEVLGMMGKYEEIDSPSAGSSRESVPVFIQQLIEEKLAAESETLKSNVMKLGSAVAAAAGTIRKTVFTAPEAVAHYTKLFVADILVSPQQGNSDSKKKKEPAGGRLRYYNVAYMNDPEEGEVLLHVLKAMGGAKFKSIADCFDRGRKKEDNNVYLGSFVPLSHKDELVMWRTYGRENNIEASGCSLTIAPAFFDSENSPLQQDFKVADGKPAADAAPPSRETLHRVIYFDKKKQGADSIIAAGKKEAVYEGLEKLTEALHNFISLAADRDENSPLCSVINRVVFRTLSEIRYLFKSADYSYENELRVIQYVDSENPRVQIDRSGSLPHRLYIESARPVKPSLQKIILGPKTPNPGQWLYLEVQMKKDGHKNMELEQSEVKFQ